MKKIISLSLVLFSVLALFAQDTMVYKLRLSYSLLDFYQNLEPEGNYPSMLQSVELSNDLYDLSFWGIDALGDLILKNRKNTTGGKIANLGLKYLTGFVFSYYGSELPIPLGVYTHEEFHRSVLGVSGYSSVNGNWIFNRWDGTVYGLTDNELSDLKKENINGLLYSYVGGVQSENFLTQLNVIRDFYHKRTFYKNPFYLYNAYYVWNYFKFSVGPESDSVKVLAPPNEDANPYYRDFAGADLTAWIYDMFSPEFPYSKRDLFPDGEGINRRIGFGDLNSEGQDFLKKQKNLSLLNFVNPAIFMINRIKVSKDFSLLFFMQYSPTHFGNDIALFIPFKTKSCNHLLAFHNYNNYKNGFFGLQYGIADIKPFSNKKASFNASISCWTQPAKQGFYDTSGKLGGNLELQANYELGKSFTANLAAGYKTEGWVLGNPYLDEKTNFRIGINYNITK